MNKPMVNDSATQVDLKIFRDGIKTSGQHPPIPSLVRPYSEFPKFITGPTVWKADEYQNNPERWVRYFTDEDIEELSVAADEFIVEKIPLTLLSKSKFVLPKLSTVLSAIRNEILNGKGFILFKGLPVEKWGTQKSAVAFMGLGTHLGYFVSQNGLGHVLGHVKDVGDDPTQIDKVRIYRTTARRLIVGDSQFFHTDECDIVGLLCLACAMEGGESDISSTHNVWNTLQSERPDVAETLTKPNWYFDRKGETSIGQQEYLTQAVFYLEPRTNGRVFAKWDPYYVKSLSRFSDKGEIPALSPEQIDAMTVLEDTCYRLKLHMILEVGDIQFLSNEHVMHSRSAYKDHLSPMPKRHLLRLWLATPEIEGGWALPFHDTNDKKRRGIQVNDQPPHAPLDAE